MIDKMASLHDVCIEQLDCGRVRNLVVKSGDRYVFSGLFMPGVLPDLRLLRDVDFDHVEWLEVNGTPKPPSS